MNDSVESRIEAAILADLKPVKPLASELRTAIALLALAAAVITAAVTILGCAGWESLDKLQASITGGLLALSLAVLAQALSAQMVPGSGRRFSPALLLTVPLLALAAANLMLFSYEPDPAFVPRGFRCWRAGVACATASAPLFWLALRRGFSLTPMLHWATAGLFSGFTGVAVLTIECARHDSAHLAVWHLGAAVAALGLGACIGMRNFKAHATK